MIRVFFRYKGRTILNCADFECDCEASKFMRNHDHEYEFIAFSKDDDRFAVLSLEDLKPVYQEV